MYRNNAYRLTVVSLPDTKLQFAVQVDITSLASKLEHVEREIVGQSQSIAHHLHCAICRVGTAAQKQENIYDRE